MTFDRRSLVRSVALLGASLALPARSLASSRWPPQTTALQLGGARQRSIMASGYISDATPHDVIGLIRSLSPRMESARKYHAKPPNPHGFAKWTIDDLDPDTDYFWQLTRNGSPYGEVCRARTLRRIGEPCTIRIAGAGCQRNNPSRRPAFDDAIAWGYDRFVHFGDDGYPHVLDRKRESHERAHAAAMTDPARGRLARFGAVDKLISDHDCNDAGGRRAGNDSNYHDPVTAASLRAWAAVVPMPMDDRRDPPRARYWSCVEGNVRFIYTDTRNLDRTDVRSRPTRPDDARSTMLGPRQLTWLKKEIDAAAAAGQFTQIFTDPGWNGVADVHPRTGLIRYSNSDKWIAYIHERDAISDHIRRAYARHGRGVNAAIAHSDTHALQFDESHERNGMLVWCCGPLDRSAHCLRPFLEAYDLTYPHRDAFNGHAWMMYQRMTWAEEPTGTLTLTVEARDCTPWIKGTPFTVHRVRRVYRL